MRIATWNVNSINARLPLIEEFLRKEEIDIAGFQETKIEDSKFPEQFFMDMGYKCMFRGQRGYNGVAVVSKYDMKPVTTDFEWIEGNEKRLIMVEIEGIKIINAYFPHGKMVFSPYYEFKINFIKKLKEFVSKFIGENLILMGDFNVAMEDIDVYQPDILQYSIGFSKMEREALMDLYNTGFVDVFRLHNRNGGQYTWWDYRGNSFRRNAGMRIDYIWATPGMAERCTKSYIDREMRAKEHPSDHAPVVAEFNARGRI